MTNPSRSPVVGMIIKTLIIDHEEETKMYLTAKEVFLFLSLCWSAVQLYSVWWFVNQIANLERYFINKSEK